MMGRNEAPWVNAKGAKVKADVEATVVVNPVTYASIWRSQIDGDTKKHCHNKNKVRIEEGVTADNAKFGNQTNGKKQCIVM